MTSSTAEHRAHDIPLTPEFAANVSSSFMSVNGIPTATAQSVTTPEDTSQTITLSGTDVDGDPLTFTVTSLPAHGALYDGADTTGHRITADELPYALSGDQVTYLPDTDYNGPDSFTIRANDGTVDSTADAAVDITVTAVNDQPGFTASNPPAVSEDAGTQMVTNWATFNPGGGSDEATQTATYTVSNVSNPGLFAAAGAPAISPAGTLTYTPAADAHGTATFDVVVQDNGGTANGGVDTSTTQTFTITVNSVNDQPSFTASNPPAVNEGAGAQTVSDWATFNPGGGDEAGQTATYTVGNVSNPGLFAAGPAVDSTGTLTYTVAANAHGTATFDVVVQDNGGTANGGVDTSTTQTFTIMVTAVNDQPVADPKTVGVTEDGAATLTLSGSDAETAAAALTFTITSLPSRGTLTLGGVPVTLGQTFTGSPSGLSYEAGAVCDGAGTDSFTYTVTDTGDPAGTPGNVLTSAPATVTITITPAVADGSVTVDANGVVRVGGTAGADRITLGQMSDGKLRVSFGSTVVSNTIPLASITEIRLWGRGGNDTLDGSGLSGRSLYLNGGAGNDTLTGSSGNGVLVGGDGDDTMTGGSGHDFLIGGSGKDRLTGSSGRDILLAGQPGCHLTLGVLRQISAAWASSGTTTSLGSILDSNVDSLTGGSEADWFLIAAPDKITDKKTKEGDVVTSS